MILGVGIDVVDVRRMGELLARYPERAAAKLFTSDERAWCDGRPRSAECYAARFAAKEALVKALGKGLATGIEWCDVQVASDGAGKPHLELVGSALARFHELGGRRVHVSLSHDGGVAAAIVIVEGSAPPRNSEPSAR